MFLQRHPESVSHQLRARVGDAPDADATSVGTDPVDDRDRSRNTQIAVLIFEPSVRIDKLRSVRDGSVRDGRFGMIDFNWPEGNEPDPQSYDFPQSEVVSEYQPPDDWPQAADRSTDFRAES